MRRLLSLLVLGLPLLLLQPLSCGGGASSERCAVACTPPSGPCGETDPSDCETACNAAVEGLTATCAQCITENTGWKGTTCGADGCPRSFGPNATREGGSGGGCSGCSASCKGFEIGKVSSSDCKAACLTP